MSPLGGAAGTHSSAMGTPQPPGSILFSSAPPSSPRWLYLSLIPPPELSPSTRPRIAEGNRIRANERRLNEVPLPPRPHPAAMPSLQGAPLVELPRKLQRSLLPRRQLQPRGADISESVLHTAVLGLLLVSGEVTGRGGGVEESPRFQAAPPPILGAEGGGLMGGETAMELVLCPCRPPTTLCCWDPATLDSGIWGTR